MHTSNETAIAAGSALPLPSPLPPWAKELLKRPLVEIRRGFSTGYDAPSEDASTIVLTAPSGKYVDIRFSTLPRSQAQAALAVKAQGKIWGYATAGLSTATIIPGKGGCPPYDCTVHATWEHPIDSSGSFDTDGADLLLLANGARMEVGSMVIRGKMQMFKEYWVTPTSGATERPCLVAELLEGGADGAKGMAIRIGDYCQGILQHGDEFWFERWEVQEGKDHKWIKDERSNTPASEMGILPCWWMTEKARTLGETLLTDGRKWCVTEVVVDDTSKL
ncbi:hypothetical protein F4821DRAFT_230764 [Hypoxylon rubiginosum]|uniref:Uncharacterized protein n=1 Tax=Hypoxylon rubiginosum TaxID=110542 RepID=A0ACC0DAD2_9PEZI|nr:hypothetical protein F4821DRAFT_230764 [Hypoxylon rubiginosum]